MWGAAPPGLRNEERATREGGAQKRPGRRAGSRAGRRAGDSRTREAILDAARKRFGDSGYAGATIRGIAADAGVDPALVHHYYGNKERLFSAAMRMPVIPGELLETALAPGSRDPGQTLGQHLVRTVVTVWDMPEIRATVLGLLRTAVTSEQAAAMLREFLSAAMLGRIAGAAADPGTPDARRRAALVASQMVGLALARYVLAIEPIASSTGDELAAAVGPTLDRYLTGELG
jgi:AcrR family transcriptional regulator